MNHQQYKFHHVSLIATAPRENEEYNEENKFFASGYFDSAYGIEWLRFEEDSPLPDPIKTIPHIAFVVPDMEAAIRDQKIIMGPGSPAPGVTVTFIEVDGAPIEFLHFDRPEHEIWPQEKKIINPANPNAHNQLPYEIAYHHFGVNTQIQQKEETYLSPYKFYCTDHEAHPFGVQWMRYEKDCQLPQVVQQNAHVAFQVDDLEAAIKDKKVIIQPNSPSAGITVAFIEEAGAPIEFLQKSN